MRASMSAKDTCVPTYHLSYIDRNHSNSHTHTQTNIRILINSLQYKMNWWPTYYMAVKVKHENETQRIDWITQFDFVVERDNTEAA